MKVIIQNADQIEQRLEDLVSRESIKIALGDVCGLLESEARQNAPKDLGDLRRSIATKIEDNGEEMTAILYTPLEYAPYVEYGTGLFAENGDGRKDVPWHYKDEKGIWHHTKGQHPQPFMRPALDQNREEILEIIKEGLLDD